MSLLITSNNLFIIPIILIIIISLVSGEINLEQFIASATSIVIHGGATGSVTCGDGSHAKANIAFIILSFNGSLQGNWTLDNLNDLTNHGTVFTAGKIFSGNVSSNQYNVNGETRNFKDAIRLCNPPLFSPISLSGMCGQKVPVNVQFQSNNPLNLGSNFNGIVVCEVLPK